MSLETADLLTWIALGAVVALILGGAALSIFSPYDYDDPS
jgi:hypothetical protein